MKLEYLHYFCETVKIGSINQAAEKLNISHQGLNRALKALETELETTLLQKTNRGVSITEQGKMLIDTATDILARWKAFEEKLSNTTATPTLKSSIHLYITPGILDFLLKNVLQPFSTDNPNIALNITERDHVDIVDALENNSADLGIFGTQYTINNTIFPEFYMASSVTFVPLYQYKIYVLASVHSPVSKYKSLSIKTLLKYPIVLSVQSDIKNDMTYRWLKLYGDPDIKFTTSSTSIYNQIINSGNAVGVSSSKKHAGINLPLDEGLTLIPLRDNDTTVTVGYLYNTEKVLTPAMIKLIDVLKNFCNR